MLAHAGEGQRCQDDSERGPCEASSLCEMDADVDVDQEKQSVVSDIDQTERHAVFSGKITVVACILQEMP